MATYSVNVDTISIQLIASQPLNNDEIIELVLLFCSCASIYPYVQHVRLLRDKYQTSLEMRELHSEILSLRDKFKISHLKNFFIAINDHSFTSVMYDIINDYQNDPAASVYASNLENIFEETPTAEFARNLLDFIDNSDLAGPGINSIIRLYTHIVEEISEYAPLPTYLQDLNIDIDTLPKLPEREIDVNYRTDLIADYILREAEGYDIYADEEHPGDNKTALMDKLRDLTEPQLKSLLSTLKVDPVQLKEIRDNKEIFQVYGPVNPYMDIDYSEQRDEQGNLLVDVIYGGARMFTDMSLEYDYDNDLPMEHWFLGYCIQCSYRIEYLHHAVREPYLDGGWRGCFCSWNCVRRYIETDNSIETNSSDDPDEVDETILKLALVKATETLMNEIKIDSRSDFKPEGEEEEEEDESYNPHQFTDLVANFAQGNIVPLKPLTITPIDYGDGTESN